MRHVLLMLSLLATACAGAGTGKCSGPTCDFSVVAPPDMMPPPDLFTEDLIGADLLKVYSATTIRAIDTGTVPGGSLVSFSGVMTTPVSMRIVSGGCTYRAWVQDPAGTAPCGIDMFTFVGTTGVCPAPGGPFAGRMQGDNVIVKGKLFIDTYASDMASTLTQHSIALDELMPSGGSATITPLMLNDPAQFTGYSAGYAMYEGMLISLGCTAGAACTSDGNQLIVKFQPAPYLWGVTGGALFGSAFAGYWPGKPGANTTAYTRIVGVANTFLTGSLEPRGPADYLP
jgi:hypothetical protein